MAIEITNHPDKMLIHNFLENSATHYPDKVAVVQEQIRITYKQINGDANKLAAFLLGRDVKVGDRIVILMENSVEYIVAYYGSLKAGAVTVPFNFDLKPDGLTSMLLEIEPSIIISSARYERLLQASKLISPNLSTLIINKSKIDWSEKFNALYSFQDILKTTLNQKCGIQAQELSRTDRQSANLMKKDVDTLDNSSDVAIKSETISVSESDLGSIVYTSGSTGKPKGVMLTHGNIVSNVNSICQYQQLTDSDVQMVVLPFFYVMGKSLLNTIFAASGTIVINNKFAFPATVINQMIEERVTLFSGVPSTYAYLLHRSPLRKLRDQLTNLRMVTQAGGHMAKSVKRDLREALPSFTQICIMYGATEASARLTWLDPNRFEEKIESIGKPIPGVTVKIIDSNRNEVKAGDTGEVVANGNNIMQGYWKDPGATTDVLSADGYHTGDIGYQDEEGFIYLSGRKDNLIKVGGHRINPQEIEDALLATKLVVEAAVVGVSDNMLGKRLVSIAVPLNGDIRSGMISEKCALILPKYKLPSYIKLVHSLPKNANGKVDQRKCLELVLHE